MPFFNLLQDCDTCPSRSKSLFCHLNSSELRALGESKFTNLYDKGQHVFNEHGNPRGIYCVMQGKVKVVATGDSGKEQIVRLAGEGDVLGYRALLSGEPYIASAVALEKTVVCFVPRDVLFELLDNNRTLNRDLFRLLATDLKEAEHRMVALAQKPVRERVAEALLLLQERYGLEEDCQTLNVTISREDIANIAGTATETAIRILSELKNDKRIDLDKKKIKILNRAALLKDANVVM